MIKSLPVFFISIFILLLTSTPALFAQGKVSLKGRVIDKQTGETLPGADVYFDGITIGGVTDSDGNYFISGIPAGDYVLIVSYIGYESYREQLSLVAGETVKKNIKLAYSGGTNLDDVVITAQAKGQMAAINQQLQSSDIKNVVSSDRIQELPDANAAESLSRLPGVSVLRSGGEGSKVVVRGLSPKYNKVMIDGVEVASTGSNDRSTNLAMISSYSLDGIEVIKSNTADLDGDFVGGMVNFKLKTAEDGFHVNVIGLGSYTHIKNSFKSYNFVANISNRFFNNKFGIFFQGNYESRNRSANERAVETWGVQQPLSFTTPNSLWPARLTLSDIDRTRKRLGGTLVLDYRLKNGAITFKNFYSQGADLVQNYSQHYLVNERWIRFSTQDYYADVLSMNNVLRYDQKFGSFHLDANLGHSYSQSQNPNNLTFNFVQKQFAMPGIPTYDASLQPEDIVSYNTFNPELIFLEGFEKEETYSSQRQFEAALNLEWTFTVSDWFSGKLKAGGKYRKKNKKNNREVFTAGLYGDASGLTNQKIAKNFHSHFSEFYTDEEMSALNKLHYASFINPGYEHDEYLSGDYGEMGPVADIDLMHQVFDFVADPATETPPYVYRQDDPDSKRFDYSGYENLYAAYIMGTFKITKIIDFIPGLRYEQNNTRYTGSHGDDGLTDTYRTKYGGYKDTTTLRNNGYLLPMIQLKIKPLNWLQLHLGYTQTLSRPSYSLLVPKQHIGAGSNSIIQNRFDLRPEQSTNYDFNVSVHQNHIGLFSVGLFAKTIKDKIFWTENKSTGENYADYGLSKKYKNRKISTQYNDTINVQIKGIELEWQTQFWYLPGALKGFVFNINYTHIWSESHYPYSWAETKPPIGFEDPVTIVHDTAFVERLIDQPNDILNISLGYDFKGFSARVSMLYNDDIFSGASVFTELRSYTGSYLRWDLSLKQDLPIEGLQIFANVNNISGTMDKTYNQGVTYPVYIEHYGMAFDLGLRWRM